MQNKAVRNLDMGRRVRDFIDAQAAHFLAASRGGELSKIINDAVAKLETAGAQQETAERSRQDATIRKDAAFDKLLEQLRAINQTARGMEKLHPGIATLFRMPRGNGDQATLNTARAFVTEATLIAVEFIERGLPADFLATLEATIAEALSAIGAQDEARRQLTASTASITAAEHQLIDAVHEFSPIVRNVFRGDKATLAAWESASHVERPPKKAKKTTPPKP